jgi:drug/metabolite transporter (DMT)-like permease
MKNQPLKTFRWLLLIMFFSASCWVFVVYRLSKLNSDLLIAVITTMAITFLISGVLWSNEIKKSECMDKDSK